MIKKLENSSSSAADNNWLDPGFLTCCTFPEIWSWSVDFGIPYFLAAHKTRVFSSMTEFIAASIASLLHCFRFLHLATLKAAGADFDLGIPLF